MRELIGKEVELNTADLTYRGILVEISEDEVLLQSDFGWVSVPLEKVTDIRGASGDSVG